MKASVSQVVCTVVDGGFLPQFDLFVLKDCRVLPIGSIHTVMITMRASRRCLLSVVNDDGGASLSVDVFEVTVTCTANRLHCFRMRMPS